MFLSTGSFLLVLTWERKRFFSRDVRCGQKLRRNSMFVCNEIQWKYRQKIYVGIVSRFFFCTYRQLLRISVACFICFLDSYGVAIVGGIYCACVSSTKLVVLLHILSMFCFFLAVLPVFSWHCRQILCTCVAHFVDVLFSFGVFCEYFIGVVASFCCCQILCTHVPNFSALSSNNVHLCATFRQCFVCFRSYLPVLLGVLASFCCHRIFCTCVPQQNSWKRNHYSNKAQDPDKFEENIIDNCGIHDFNLTLIEVMKLNVLRTYDKKTMAVVSRNDMSLL